MRIVELVVRNFRAIRELSWQPPAGSVCLVGPGDAGKTTVLDAIDLALSSRGWVTFVESDFFGGVVTGPIEIMLTVTHLPPWTLSQDKYGLELRGWTTAGVIRDEPEDDDEPALTIRLRVDELLEPTWTVVSTRNPDGRAIPARDRERLGATRIGDDVDRQLAWGRSSALTRITDDPEAIGEALSEAHRIAREAVTQADLHRLQAAAARAGDAGARFGSNVELPLSVGVDPRALSVGTAALGLRLPSGVPARSLGLGSRRLLALSVQLESIGEGAITLVDEIEAGLEPHRLRHLIQHMQRSESQIIMTSHSPATVAELGTNGLGVVRRATDGTVQVLHPDPDLQGLVRALPDAILARRVVVCEGQTEYGLSRSLVAHWDQGRPTPLAWSGAVFVPGGGAEAPRRALLLRRLGYDCAYWADADVTTDPSATELQAVGLAVIQWSEGKNTEQRLMSDVPESALAVLWQIAASEKGLQSITDQLADRFQNPTPRPPDLDGWKARVGVPQLRDALGAAAAAGGWYKNIRGGQAVGAALAQVLHEMTGTDLHDKLSAVEQWAYGD